MKISDLDQATRLVLFRAKMVTRHSANLEYLPDDLQKLKAAQDEWEATHAEEICANIFRALHDPSVTSVSDDELECDSCAGTGLMEGWNHRDGNSCPKCKGAGVVSKGESK